MPDRPRKTVRALVVDRKKPHHTPHTICFTSFSAGKEHTVHKRHLTRWVQSETDPGATRVFFDDGINMTVQEDYYEITKIMDTYGA